MSTKVFGQDIGKVKDNILKFFSLWGDAVISVLPRSIQNQLIVGEEQIIVILQDKSLSIIQNQSGQTLSLGEFSHEGNYCEPEVFNFLNKRMNGDNELILAVSEQMVLSKKIDFPVAVAENLKQTLFYELDKHTPFPKDQILYDVDILNKTSGKVFANLYILHKPAVIELLNLFSDNHIQFDRLCTTKTKKINLLPDNLQKKHSLFRFRMGSLLFIFTGILLLIALATPLYFKRQTAVELDKEIGRLEPLASGEIALWERRDKAEQVLLSFLNAHPLSFSRVYEELATLLPDNTWVNGLNLKDNKVTLYGESTDAATLIAIINSSPLFSNAKIISPIIKSNTNNKEIFHISFELVSGK